jgi:hypothetical protein
MPPPAIASPVWFDPAPWTQAFFAVLFAGQAMVLAVMKNDGRRPAVAGHVIAVAGGCGFAVVNVLWGVASAWGRWGVYTAHSAAALVVCLAALYAIGSKCSRQPVSAMRRGRWARWLPAVVWGAVAAVIAIGRMVVAA